MILVLLIEAITLWVLWAVGVIKPKGAGADHGLTTDGWAEKTQFTEMKGSIRYDTESFSDYSCAAKLYDGDTIPKIIHIEVGYRTSDPDPYIVGFQIWY